MNLGLFAKLDRPKYGNLAQIASNSTYLSKHKGIDDRTRYTYDVDLIELLDKALFENNTQHLTRNQERALFRYLYEGGKVTEKYQSIKNINDRYDTHFDPFRDMSDAFRQLDIFLGSWRYKNKVTTIETKPDKYSNVGGGEPSYMTNEVCEASPVTMDMILKLFEE